MSICAMNSLLSHKMLIVLFGMYAFELGMGSPVKDRVYPEMNPNYVPHAKVGHDYPDMNTETCGLFNGTGIQTRIVNGAVAEKGEFPWMASIHGIDNPSYTFICGGVLFGERWIVTAKHCREKFKLTTYANIKVYLGSLKKFESAVEYGIDWYIMHTEFDIGLIKLSQPVKPIFDGNVYVINSACMPAKGMVNEHDEDALLSGFGAVDVDNKIPSDVLRQTRIYIMGNGECMQKMPKEFRKVSEHMCAIETEHPFCGGDSGSPLVQLEGNRAVVIGIAASSFAEDKDNDGTCSRGTLIFTRVSLFIDWLAITMKFVPAVHVDPTTDPNGVDNHSHAVPYQMVLWINLIAIVVNIVMQTN